MPADRRRGTSCASIFGHGLAAAARNAIRLRNLKWVLPIAAAPGLLITSSDDHINSQFHSPSFAQAASRGSNVGLGIELGTAELMYLAGCSGPRSAHAANTGFTALEAMGAASLMTLGINAAANRQYAYDPSTHGEFWGRQIVSFGACRDQLPSASVIAHRYPNKRWLKWSVYGLATAVSLARVGAKKHFASDIL